MEHKPQIGDTLIIKKNNSLTPIKIQVLEVTKTTYYFANLDEKIPAIQKLDNLGANYVINTDAVPKNTTEEIIKDFKKYQSQWLVKDETECNVKFRMLKEEFEMFYQVVEVIDTVELQAKRLSEIFNPK